MVSVRRVAFRRRREGKTDYHQRRALIKSGAIRLIIRCTLNNCIVQFAKAEPKGDRIILSATSRELRNYGWKAPCGNISSAYLTGFLAALKAKKDGLTDAVLDVGIKKPVAGSKIYAGLKGVLDGGINIPVSDEIFPDESRISGVHIVNYWNSIDDQTERERKFSIYLKNNLIPEKIPEHFEEVKKEIEKILSG